MSFRLLSYLKKNEYGVFYFPICFPKIVQARLS